MAKEAPAAPTEETPAIVYTSDPNEPMGDPTPDNPSPEIVADAPEPAPTPAAADADDDAEPAAPPPNKRAEQMARIAERMKKKRAEDAGRSEEAADAPEPAPEPAVAAPAPAAAPEPAEAAPADKRKFKLKVRQQDLELDEDKVVELAQKAAAADSYFEDGKRFFEEAKQARDQSRTAPGAPHQEQSADNAEPVPEPTPASPGKFKKLIEDIQFGGDPDALAAQLQDAVSEAASSVATTAARTASVEQRFQEDHAHTMKVLQRMKEAEPALFDADAEAVMSRRMFDAYREDLRAAGIAEEKIPKDKDAIVDLHRLSRIQGKPGIRSAEQLLGDVRDGYKTWRGIAPKPAAPAPADPAAASPSPAPRPVPRVVVNREERRQAIPTQPQRAGAPPSLPAAAPQPRTREQKMAQMRAARGQR